MLGFAIQGQESTRRSNCPQPRPKIDKHLPVIVVEENIRARTAPRHNMVVRAFEFDAEWTCQAAGIPSESRECESESEDPMGPSDFA